MRPGSDSEQREAVLLRWYREQLKGLISPLLVKWQSVLGVQASAWGIKKMKTKWGSCNPSLGRLWLNLELAKAPVQSSPAYQAVLGVLLKPNGFVIVATKGKNPPAKTAGLERIFTRLTLRRASDRAPMGEKGRLK